MQMVSAPDIVAWSNCNETCCSIFAGRLYTTKSVVVNLLRSSKTNAVTFGYNPGIHALVLVRKLFESRNNMKINL